MRHLFLYYMARRRYFDDDAFALGLRCYRLSYLATTTCRRPSAIRHMIWRRRLLILGRHCSRRRTIVPLFIAITARFPLSPSWPARSFGDSSATHAASTVGGSVSRLRRRLAIAMAILIDAVAERGLTAHDIRAGRRLAACSSQMILGVLHCCRSRLSYAAGLEKRLTLCHAARRAWLVAEACSLEDILSTSLSTIESRSWLEISGFIRRRFRRRVLAFGAKHRFHNTRRLPLAHAYGDFRCIFPQAHGAFSRRSRSAAIFC